MPVISTVLSNRSLTLATYSFETRYPAEAAVVAMQKEFTDLTGWIFDIDELSYGVYKVVARDLAGRSIVKTGQTQMP